MSKPEDIPQDVWDDAAAYVAAAPLTTISCGDPDHYHWISDPQAAVARAIMAAKAEEREAIIKLCDDEIEQAKNFGPHHVPIIASLRAAIRKRGEVNTAHTI